MLILVILTGILLSILANYLADVLPKTRHLSRVLCANCSRPVSFKEYIFFRKCPQCGQKRSARAFITLILMVAASIALYLFPLAGMNYWATLPLLLFLAVIVIIDIEHRLLLIETSLVGIVLCFVYGLFINNLLMTLLGGAFGFAAMLLFFFLGIAMAKIVGKLRHQEIDEVAFGFGDVFAGTFLGLLCGAPYIFKAILVAMIAFAGFSLVYIGILLITRKYKAFSTAVPFIPFLVLGAIVTLYGM